MARTAIQLHTLRTLDEPIPALLARVAATELDGVEFARLDGTPPETIADALDDAGLEPVGAHVRVETLEDAYDEVVETYATFGCTRLVVPTFAAEAFQSVAGVADAARRLRAIAAKLDADGFELLYHNHTFEFVDLGGETAFDAFAERTAGAIDLEIDTGLAAHAGADPLDLLSRYRGRVPVIHLTDTVPGEETTLRVELGAGELDVEACVEAACDVGVEWLVYEHGRTSDPADSLVHAATKLPTLLGRLPPAGGTARARSETD